MISQSTQEKNCILNQKEERPIRKEETYSELPPKFGISIL